MQTPQMISGSIKASLQVWPRTFACRVAWMVAAALVLQGYTASAQTPSNVVISQVYGGGGNSGATLRNDFIEIFNRERVAVNVSGWSVQYASATGTSWLVTNLSGTIEPGQHYLVQQAPGAGGTNSLPNPDASGAIAMSASDGKVALVASTAPLSGSCPTAEVVDLVGYGSSSCFEGAAASRSLSNTTAALRIRAGCADTNQNANDFQSGLPTPRNTTAPLVDCNTSPGAVIPIHALQGKGSASPLVGQNISVQAIVTAVKSNGFFVQMPDAAVDGDPDTSEGILVFTGGIPPPAALVGNEVVVSGTVEEFRPSTDPASPPVTEIVGATVTASSSGHPLPAPVTLTAADAQPGGSIEQMERYEGMRVRADSLTVVAPTQGAVNESTAVSTSNGVFYAVITGTDRPFREPGIQTPDAPPPGSACCIPVFDANPERLRVDSDAQIGAARLEVTAGAIVTGVVGVLDYGFRAYTIVPDPGAPVRLTGNVSASPLKAPLAQQFAIATFNMERFFNDVADSGASAPLLSPTGFQNRLGKASMIIRGVLRSPDILGVEEVENLATLRAVADRLNADSVAAGEPNPEYRAHLEEGNDVGGIDSGFLVKSSRVTVVDVTQEGKTTTYLNPADGSMALLNDRPPLVLRAAIASPPGPAFPLTVIVNHLRSLTDVGADGRVRAKRAAQAEYLARLIQARQIANPDEAVVVLGDFNAFQFSDGYVDSIGAIKGAPVPANTVVLASPALVEPNLERLEAADPAQHYSYVFDGSAQTLDHVLITRNLLGRFDSLHYGRVNADFPDSYRNDASRPERLSDHDPVVAYFNLPSAPAALALAQAQDRSAAATIGPAGPPLPTVTTARMESIQLSGQAPQGLDVDIETGLVYVSNNGSAVAGCSPGSGIAGTLSIVDPGLLRETHRVENVRGTVWPLVDYARNVVYSANSGGKSLTVHARGTGALLATIPLGGRPHQIGMDPASPTLVVSNTNDESQTFVALVNADSRELTGHLKVAPLPHGVAVDLARHHAYVSSVSDGTNTIIDLAAGAMVGTLPTTTALNPNSNLNAFSSRLDRPRSAWNIRTD